MIDHKPIVNDITAKFIALIFGVILWFLASSDVVYEYATSLPLKIEGIPTNLIAMTDAPQTIDVVVVGKGRDLFQLNLTKPTAYYRLESPEIGKNYHHLTADNVDLPLLSDIQLHEIQNPTYIVFDFDENETKVLSINVPTANILLPNLILKSPLSWKPNRAEITGPSRILDKLTVIHTDTLDLSRIIASSQFYLAIGDLPEYQKITCNPESIEVSVDVEQLLTFQYDKVPIQLINFNNKLVKYNPRQVNVKVTVAESKSREYRELKSSDLIAVIDGRFYRDEELSLPPWIRSPAVLFKDAVFDPPTILVAPLDGE